MQHFKAVPAVLLAGIFVVGGCAGVPTPASAQLQYRVSWVGNSFGKDHSNKWVQNNIGGMWVASDGTCYTNSRWDEGHREGGVYRNGDVVGNLGNGDLHTSGGNEVTGNATHIFVNADKATENIRRYNRSNHSRSSWPSEGKTANSLNVGGTIRGLAYDATNNLLFCADDVGKNEGQGEIRVINPVTMEVVHAFDVPKPRRLAIAPDGSVWVANAGSGAAPKEGEPVAPPIEILHYSVTGALLNQKIVGGPENPGFNPAALAFDKAGRLLVADNGPHQQIKIYTNLGQESPTLSATIGARGGIFSGTAGAVAPLKFNFITGLGLDASGNIYVGQNRFGVGTNSYAGPGSILESYNPAGTTLNWKLQSLEFVSGGDFTPGTDGREVFSNLSRYMLDLSKTEPGSEATYVGHTLNPFKYPDDERWIRRDNNYNWVTGYVVRVLGGQKFQFHTMMRGGRVSVSRFNARTDGEIAVPCGEFGTTSFWRDLDGDGTREPSEMTPAPETPSGKGVETQWVDLEGTLWQCFGSDGAARPGGIRRFAFLGLDERGIPQWDAANPTVITQPAPFSAIHRVEYIPATDTMFLSGYSNALDPDNGWGKPGFDEKSIGSVVARYDGWSKGNREAKWAQVIPDYRRIPNSWSIAGDFIFLGYDAKQAQPDNGHIQIRRASDGVHLGRMWAGPNNIGRIDIKHGVSAMKRSNGEYLVLSEDDWYARLMLWRWTPPQTAPTAPTVTVVNGNSYAKLNWTAQPGASLYELHRASQKDGPFSLVARLEGTQFTDTNGGAGLTNGSEYHYVVKAIGAAGDSPNSTPKTATPSGLLPLKIDSGTGSETGDWIGDTFVSGGNSIGTGGDSTTGVANAAPAAIYTTTRRQGDPIRYTFRNQSAGTNYTIRLHFGEWWHDAGGRKINIVINGVVREANLDVAAITGGKNRALVREYSGITPGADGNIVVEIAKGTETMIDGIEMLPS